MIELGRLALGTAPRRRPVRGGRRRGGARSPSSARGSSACATSTPRPSTGRWARRAASSAKRCAGKPQRRVRRLYEGRTAAAARREEATLARGAGASVDTTSTSRTDAARCARSRRASRTPWARPSRRHPCARPGRPTSTSHSRRLVPEHLRRLRDEGRRPRHRGWGESSGGACAASRARPIPTASSSPAATPPLDRRRGRASSSRCARRTAYAVIAGGVAGTAASSRGGQGDLRLRNGAAQGRDRAGSTVYKKRARAIPSRCRQRRSSFRSDIPAVTTVARRLPHAGGGRRGASGSSRLDLPARPVWEALEL